MEKKKGGRYKRNESTHTQKKREERRIEKGNPNEEKSAEETKQKEKQTFQRGKTFNFSNS